MQAYSQDPIKQESPKQNIQKVSTASNPFYETNNSMDYRLRPVKSLSLNKLSNYSPGPNQLNPEPESLKKGTFKNQSCEIAGNTSLLKTTTLQFHTKKSQNKKIMMPLTVQNWLATRSTTMLVRNKPLLKNSQSNKPAIYYSSNQQLNEVKYQIRDAQSLLRKNSLYLLSFITTKERKSISIPQVKNTPFVIDKIPPINSLRTDRKQRLERQKNFIQNLKSIKQTSLRKNNGISPSFLPQPW